MKKRILAIILVLAILLSAAGGALAETREQQLYEDAQSLLSQGKYGEAREAFLSLGALKEAPKYAMYAGALQMAEEQGYFLLAITDLEALDDFLDSRLRKKYYTARAYEDVEHYEEAQEIYYGIIDYRDSSQRGAAMPAKINARDYAKADALEQLGELEDALKMFAALGGYRDSADRAETVREKIRARDYAEADRLEKAGQLEQARDAFRALQDYLDSAERAENIQEKIYARDYAKAEEYEQKEKYSEAYQRFKSLKNYRDSADRAAKIYEPAMYEDALGLADSGKYKQAAELLRKIASYRDSEDKAYVLGVADFADECYLPSDRVFVFKHHDLYGIVNYQDNLARPALYTQITAFDQGVAIYCYEEKYGLVYPDMSATENKWSVIDSFQTVRGKRLARAGNGEKYGYIGEDANAVVLVRWSGVSGFNSSGVCYVTDGTYYGLADYTGKTLSEPVWKSLNGKKPDLYRGKLAEIPGVGKEPVTALRSDGLYGYINWSGEVVVEPRFKLARAFSDGLAAVAEDELWGFIDTEGNYVIRPQYEKVTSFINGRAEVWIPESGWHVIDKTNRRVYFTSSKLKKADDLMADGHYQEAAELYMELEKQDPLLKDKTKEAWYRQGEYLLAAGDIDGASDAFTKAGDYQDAADRMMKYHYDLAEAALAAGDDDTALTEFAAAGNYLDASDRCGKIHYERAEAALTIGKWAFAAAEFKAAGRYSDAMKRTLEPYYRQGEALMAAGDYEGAEAAFRKAATYGNAQEMIQETKYQHANALYDQGKYTEAFEAFKELENYKDSRTRVTNDENFAALLEEEQKGNFRTVGKTVMFGTYEQDNNESNGAERIEWVVLDVQDGKALLLSVYGLETMSFNNKKGAVTWSKSSIRKWLNSNFLKEAFTKEEQAAIPVTVNEDKNNKQTSKDQVFFLNMPEVRKYLSDSEYLLCMPSVRAKAAKPSCSKEGYVYWWTRSTSNKNSKADAMTYDNRTTSFTHTSKLVVVRPAIWVDLAKLQN